MTPRAARLASFLLAAGLALQGCSLPRWPVDAPVTSGFGLRFLGMDPDIHRGVDLSVGTGTPVGAMSRAQVRFAGVMTGFGNVVWLDHGGGTLTVYAHLSEVHVREGEQVQARQIIGLSGATGNVTAPHLHFEVWRWGREVDPVPLLGGLPGRS
jgi:murein DD-endopeptidase MepM/ murein hydrolase activator NlpD